MLKVERKGNVLYARGRHKGADIKRSLGLPPSELARANAVVAKMQAKLNAGNSEAVYTFDDACDAYVERGAEVGDTDLIYINRLRQDLGAIQLERVTRKLVDDVVTQNRLTVRVNAPSSVRRELTTLQAIMNYAVENEMTEHTVKIKKPRGDNKREVWLDEAQAEEFMLLCDEEFRPFATFLFFTGARLGEALAARWDDVRAGAVTLRTRKGKGSRERQRSVPLHGRVTDLIGTSGKGWLLKRSCGSCWTKRVVYERWNAARKKMGVADLTPHCARHSFASNLIIAGVDSRTVAELLGHASMNMMQRYTHLSLGHLNDAMSRLGV